MNDSPAPVGRPRSFDADAALAAAMEAFWANGYEATTYGSLEAATGLRRQSLIYAFGDKRQMFEQALGLYAARRVNEVVELLEAEGSALDNVRTVLDSWLADAAHETHPGCLLVNTAGELGRSEPGTSRIVAAATEKLAAAFERAFERALEAGEIRAGVDPADLARLAVSAGDGALLHARASGNVDHSVRVFRALLGLMS